MAHSWPRPELAPVISTTVPGFIAPTLIAHFLYQGNTKTPTKVESHRAANRKLDGYKQAVPQRHCVSNHRRPCDDQGVRCSLRRRGSKQPTKAHGFPHRFRWGNPARTLQLKILVPGIQERDQRNELNRAESKLEKLGVILQVVQKRVVSAPLLLQDCLNQTTHFYAQIVVGHVPFS